VLKAAGVTCICFQNNLRNSKIIMFFTIVEGISIFVQTSLGSMMVLLLAEGHDPLGFCHHEIAQH